MVIKFLLTFEMLQDLVLKLENIFAFILLFHLESDVSADLAVEGLVNIT